MTLKSETSYLGQHQKREEVKGKSHKETELAPNFRKRERCETNVGEHGKVHVRYYRDKIGMSSDEDRVSCNDRLYPMIYRNTCDPDEDDKLVYLARGCNNVGKGNIKDTPIQCLVWISSTAGSSRGRYGKSLWQSS